MSLEAAVARATGRAVRSLRRVGGGDINEAYAAELEDGGHAFVKTRADAPAGEYASEAAGLRWLAVPNGLGVPEVLGVLDDDDAPRLLALEWLEPGAAGDEAELGRGLAWVHAAGAAAFGARRAAAHRPARPPERPAAGLAVVLRRAPAAAAARARPRPRLALGRRRACGRGGLRSHRGARRASGAAGQAAR